MKRTVSILLALSVVMSLSACGNRSQNNESPAGTAAAKTEATSAEIEAPAGEENSAEEVKAVPAPEDYVPDPEGYYNLLDEGYEFSTDRQKGGTCWIYSAVACMESNYAMKFGKPLEMSHTHVLDVCYLKKTDDENPAEGYYMAEGFDRNNLGGWPWIVVESMANGCDGIVLDDVHIDHSRDRDEIKADIKKYGAASIGTCDTAKAKKAMFGPYRTMNLPDPDEFDHQITIIGWDDNFPKEYFEIQPEENGAWITYDSLVPTEKYYLSYETPIDYGLGLYYFSVTDKYSEVESYNATHQRGISIKTGEPVKVANVYHKKGILGAVGTFNDMGEQDITIEIYDSDFKNVLYTQQAKLNDSEYQLIELDEPLEVEDYAVAITYSLSAPVEGGKFQANGELKHVLRIEPGQSYFYIADKDEWKDMADEDINDYTNTTYKCRNACIKAVYK